MPPTATPVAEHETLRRCDPAVGGRGDARADDEQRGSGDLGTAGRLADWTEWLSTMPIGYDDPARIDQVRALEELKCACAAAQARVTAEFAASQRAKSDARENGRVDDEVLRAGDADGAGADAGAGVSLAQRRARLREKAERLARRSSAAQIALARHESPARGGRYVGLAETLVSHMPRTLAALGEGVINEWRATIIVKEAAVLSDEQREALDAEISGRLDGLGDKRLQSLVKSIAYRMEPEAATERAARAARDRRVTIRPAPDSMAYLTALLPVGSAVTCYAALKRAAEERSVEGRAVESVEERAVEATDGVARTHAQRMADTLVAAVAGNHASRTGRAQTGTDSSDRDTEVIRDEAPADPVEAIRAAYAAHQRARAESGSGPSSPRPAGPSGVSQTVGAEPTSGASPAGSSGVLPTVGPSPASMGSASRHPAPAGGPAASADAAPTPTGPHRPPSVAESHTLPDGAGVVINIVISDETLFAGGDKPAYIDGNLPLPAPLARRMIADLPETAKVWLRRLYTRPDTGALAAMDSRRRIFPPGMRQQLLLRDQDTCRIPYCDAPARHADHVRPQASGGPTSIANGQSLSEDCNYTRAAPGWSAVRRDDGAIVITTPTGHRYESPEPAVA